MYVLFRMSLVTSVLLGIPPSDGAKILLLPASQYSHCSEISSVGQGLADKGHQVSIFLASNFEARDCYSKFSFGRENKIHPIIYQSKPNVPSIAEFENNMTKLVEESELDLIKHLGSAKEYVRANCAHLLWDSESLLALKREKFDLVIVDSFFLSYYVFVIPYKLGVPYVSISTVFDDIIIGRPLLFSILPNFMSKFSDEMTFAQRFVNALNYLGITMLSYWTMPLDIVSEVAPELSTRDVINLVSQSELFLWNYDTVLAYPAPSMPNNILIGGINTVPAKPLSGLIKEFYSQTTDVVVITFGGTFPQLPRRVEKNLVTALKRTGSHVLWKSPNEGRDGKILRMKWLPQNDVLGHPKTNLFISHCGNNGLFEALYHGVPVLCTPIFGDQFYNAMRMKRWNVGSYINLFKSSDEELFVAISDILTNPIYSQNMKKASEMFHSQPMTPRQRSTFWIEYVLKFGGKHLRPRGMDMSVFSLLGYDLLLFVLGVVATILLVLFKIVSWCCSSCCKNRSSKVKTS